MKSANWIYKFIVLLISYFIIIISNNSKAQAFEPIEVKIGTQLQKVTPNFKDGTFFAEFYWWMIIKNDTNKTKIRIDEILHMQYVNAAGVSVAGLQKEVQERKVIDEHTYYIVGLHQGPFIFYPDYKEYPFDVQKLPIMMDHATLTSDQLYFVPDTNSYIKSGQQKGLWSISEELLKMKSKIFNIKSAHTTVYKGNYNTDFGDVTFPPVSTFSRYENMISINRQIIPFITKSIIPIIFILCLTYMVFFLEADKLDSARGMAVTSMFSSFAFQMTSTKDLPDIGYVIYVDKVFYLVYFLIAASIVCVIVRYNIDKAKKENHELIIRRINYTGRIIFPLIFIGGAVALAFL